MTPEDTVTIFPLPNGIGTAFPLAVEMAEVEEVILLEEMAEDTAGVEEDHLLSMYHCSANIRTKKTPKSPSICDFVKVESIRFD